MEGSKEVKKGIELANLAQQVAKEARVNNTIIKIFNEGALDNWNGVSRLPTELLKVEQISSISGNEKHLKMLMLANIFARAATNFGNLLGNQPKLTEFELPEQTRQQLLGLALILYSYPKGISPTNERITLQIQRDKLLELANIFSQLGSVEESLQNLGFENNPAGDVLILATTPSELGKKIGEILGNQKP